MRNELPSRRLLILTGVGAVAGYLAIDKRANPKPIDVSSGTGHDRVAKSVLRKPRPQTEFPSTTTTVQAQPDLVVAAEAAAETPAEVSVDLGPSRQSPTRVEIYSAPAANASETSGSDAVKAGENPENGKSTKPCPPGETPLIDGACRPIFVPRPEEIVPTGDATFDR